MSRLDSLASVGMITAPTLVVAGERDRICDPGHSREISEQVPRSQLLIFPDCGHLAPIERPELFGKLLSDWMNWGD